MMKSHDQARFGICHLCTEPHVSDHVGSQIFSGRVMSKSVFYMCLLIACLMSHLSYLEELWSIAVFWLGT